MASKHNMKFIEASAKDGYNIDEIFNFACQKIYENIEKGVYDFENNEEAYGIKKYRSSNEFIENKTFYLRKENHNDNEEDNKINDGKKNPRKKGKKGKKKC